MAPAEPAAPELVLTEISRSMIDRDDRAGLLVALDAMTIDAQTVRRFGGTVRLMFTGYENDPRELYEIEEVRRYVQQLTQDFPYWLHFGDKRNNSLLVLLLCLAPIERSTTVDGVVSSVLNAAALNDRVQELFGYMNGLYAHFGLTARENSATTQQVAAYLRQNTAPFPG